MKVISRNKQKDKNPLGGLSTIQSLLMLPLSVFGIILTTAHMAVPTTF